MSFYSQRGGCLWGACAKVAADDTVGAFGEHLEFDKVLASFGNDLVDIYLRDGDVIILVCSGHDDVDDLVDFGRKLVGSEGVFVGGNKEILPVD